MAAQTEPTPTVEQRLAHIEKVLARLEPLLDVVEAARNKGGKINIFKLLG